MLFGGGAMLPSVTMKGGVASGSWEELSPVGLCQGQARSAGLTVGG